MTPSDLANLHAASFQDTRSWSEAEFAALLSAPINFLVTGRESFALGRTIGEEAELLTIAVYPDLRRIGLGRTILEQFEAMAQMRGANHVFLEVSAVNQPAINLYNSTGYNQISKRDNYYKLLDGSLADALMFSKSLN